MTEIINIDKDIKQKIRNYAIALDATSELREKSFQLREFIDDTKPTIINLMHRENLGSLSVKNKIFVLTNTVVYGKHSVDTLRACVKEFLGDEGTVHAVWKKFGSVVDAVEKSESGGRFDLETCLITIMIGESIDVRAFSQILKERRPREKREILKKIEVKTQEGKGHIVV